VRIEEKKRMQWFKILFSVAVILTVAGCSGGQFQAGRQALLTEIRKLP
jgi:hypothetical protein